MLFFLAGSVKHRYHTLEISRLSGHAVQMPRLGWILGFCAMASLGLPGLAGFWGEFPAILSAYDPPEAFGLSETLFRTLMVHRRRRHGVRRRLPAVAVPAHGVRRADARVRRHADARRTPTPSAPPSTPITATTTTARRHPRRDADRVDRLDAAADPHRRARRLPAAAVQGLRPGRHRARRPPRASDLGARDRVRSLARRRPTGVAAGRSTGTRSRPSSSSIVGHQHRARHRPARRRDAASGSTATLTGFVLLGAFIPLVTLAVIGDDVALAVRRPLRRRRVLARPQGAVPARRATSSC